MKLSLSNKRLSLLSGLAWLILRLGLVILLVRLLTPTISPPAWMVYPNLWTGISMISVAANSIAENAVPSSLADLPPQAQAIISAAIGRDQTAYHVRPQTEGYRVDNPAHGLAVTFSATGLQVRADNHSWGMVLTGYGYGEQLRPVAALYLTAVANRVEYRYASAITEWYVNGPLGLEQGWILAAPPVGERVAGQPLTLALVQTGDVQANLVASGQELVLTAPDGLPVLRYTGLAAYDATGRTLPAWLTVCGGGLLVQVDDAGARYPLVIDPWTQAAKLTASDKAVNDQFGEVAISGDTVVVGAYRANPGGITDAGAAYVFVKPGGGWTDMIQVAKLTASDKAMNDQFGRSVTVSGDTVVVGAYRADPSPIDAGAAYVFVKPGGGWTGDLVENAKLTASDKATNDFFGISSAISGDTVVIGAYGAEPGGIYSAGAAYVFVKPVGGWSGSLTESAKLTASDKATQDSFGTSVAISGDTVIVGAYYADVGAGAAYVFVKPGGGWTGNLTESAKLTASDKAANDNFGISVAISGDTVVAGAYGADPGDVFEAGAAYVFVKPEGGWTGNLTQTAKLIAGDKAASDGFGVSVAASGDTIVVGAYGADLDNTININAGAAYVFVKPGGGWTDMTQTAKLTASDKAASTNFGKSVAVNNDTVVAGAPYAHLDDTADAGAAYVFGRNNNICYLPVIFKNSTPQ